MPSVSNMYNRHIYSYFFRVASLALGQSCDNPSAGDVTLGDMVKITPTRTYPMTMSSNRNIFRITFPLWGEFPSENQWRGALIFSLISAWTNGWTNNRDAGDLRRHHAHYDVTVMHSNIPTVCIILGMCRNYPHWQRQSCYLNDKMIAMSPTTFKIHFREWKVLNFDSNFTEVCS